MVSKRSRKRPRRGRSTLQDGRAFSGQFVREVFEAAAQELTANDQGQVTQSFPTDTYLRERAALIEMEHKSSEQHDKAILTLAAGALALSLTFLEKIAPQPKTTTVTWIAASWAAFIFSVVTILASFLTSQVACRKQCDALDKLFAGKEVSPKLTKWAVATGWLNLVSYLAFVAGLIALAFFGFFNLPTERENAVSKPSPSPESIDLSPKPNTGRVPPSPPAAPTNIIKEKPQLPVKK